MEKCYSCKKEEVAEEFDRCLSCKAEHQKLIQELNARPRVKEKKVREELFPIREVKGGIQVTTWIDRNDAHNMGINLNK